MNFNDPVDQDAAHSCRYVRLVLHVADLGLVERLGAEIMLHDVLGELCHALRVRGVLLIAGLDDILEMFLASLLEDLVCGPQPLCEGLLRVDLFGAFDQLYFLLLQS